MDLTLPCGKFSMGKIMMSKIKDFYYKAKRFIEYGKLSFETYDHDASSVYDVIHFQLKRTSDFMHSDNTWTMWTTDHNSRPMRELREVVELSRRLKENDYNENWLKVYNKKKEKYDLFLSWDLPEEERKQYYIESNRAIKKDSQLAKSHRKRLFHLLNKRIDFWWD